MKDKKKDEIGFMDIWSALSGEEEYILKVIQSFEEDIDTCLHKTANRLDVILTEDDIEDAKQYIKTCMMVGIKRFEFYM